MDRAPWAILKEFCRVFCACSHEGRVTRIVTYAFKDVSFSAHGDNMALVLKDTEVPGTVTVTVAFIDAKGKRATVDGPPTWIASDTNIIDNITPSADGMSAAVHIVDNVGASQLIVNADVDLGAGTKNVDFVDTVSVIAGEAVAANFTFGAVTPDP